MFKKFWDRLSTQRKKVFIWLGIALIAALIVIVGYRIWAAETFDLLDGSSYISSISSVERIDDKYYADRSIKVSKKMYPNGLSPSVVLGITNENAESMQAGILAGALKVPFLVSSSDKVTDRVLNEITRLNPQKIYLVGSSVSLKSSVQTQLKSRFPTKNIVTVGGSNRNALAQNVGLELIKLNGGVLADNTIMVTNGNHKYVGIIGYYAGIKKYPVLMADTSIPSETALFIASVKPTKTIIVSGVGTIPDSIAAKMPGGTRISGDTRFDLGVNLHKSATSLNILNNQRIAIVSDQDLVGGAVLSPYMAMQRGGMILDDYNAMPVVLSYMQSLRSSYGLRNIYVTAKDLDISSTSLMKYSNILGSNYNDSQLSLQRKVDDRIRICPKLTGSLADYGDAKGYQAITYYTSGKIVVSPTYRTDLDKIINHEIYHIIDYRDNGKIDWGENVPRTTPDCIP